MWKLELKLQRQKLVVSDLVPAAHLLVVVSQSLQRHRINAAQYVHNQDVQVKALCSAIFKLTLHIQLQQHLSSTPSLMHSHARDPGMCLRLYTGYIKLLEGNAEVQDTLHPDSRECARVMIFLSTVQSHLQLSSMQAPAGVRPPISCPDTNFRNAGRSVLNT